MIGLGDFFKKVQNSFTKEIFMRTEIKDSIKNTTGLELRIEDISCKGSVVFLKNVNQMMRSVIFIKKQVILKNLAEKQGLKKIIDIR